jgi:ribonuclease E
VVEAPVETAEEAPAPQAANDQDASGKEAVVKKPRRRSAAALPANAPEAPVLERREPMADVANNGEEVDVGEGGGGRRGWWQRTFGA